MAKKKTSSSKSHSIKKNRPDDGRCQPEDEVHQKFSLPIIVAGIAILIAVAASFFATSFSKSQQQQPSPSVPDEIVIHQQKSTKDAFLNWFTDNGGTFHPISFINNKGDETANVTIEEFPSFGGWGLALPITAMSKSNADDECSSRSNAENTNDNQCSAAEEENNDISSPIIRHLQPLFTVPSSIIISVESILDTYATPSSPKYLPDFYPKVNKILTQSFPTNNNNHQHGSSSSSPGLAKRGMGLVQQDVVIAMYLMVEDCQHHNHNQQQRSDDDSFWGPYLDVLPKYIVPRLDTFSDEEYAALQDEKLEYVGRQSRRLLEKMYAGDGNNFGVAAASEGLSLKGVVESMIRQKFGSTYSIPKSCISFDVFHRFVAIVSSRAMVLKGVKHLTPLAEMINYAPISDSQQHNQNENFVRAPFDLFHQLSDDNSITVRSDRDVFATQTDPDVTSIQLFEDYGPVDSSLFLEAHGFVPYENPNNCATLSVLRRNVATGRTDENVELLLRALKSLYLIHPETKNFEMLEDVCVKSNMELVDDGNTIGRKPASDSIAIASLLLGDSGNWDQIGDSFNSLRKKCIDAIRSGDSSRMETRCARFPGSDTVVKQALQTAASRAISRLDDAGDTETKLLLELEKAKSQDRVQLALALRFRLEERKILSNVAQSRDEDSQRDRFDVESPKSIVNLEEKLDAFKSFVHLLDLPLNKIEPRFVGDGMRLGAFATHDLEIDDAYISLSPSSVIDVTSALADVDEGSDFAALLRKYARSGNSRQNGGFDALLIYLLHERFLMKEQSRWHPYLDLLPTIEELSEFHPLFFSQEEIDRYLAGSDVRQFILKYQRRASERHTALSSDLDANIVIGSNILLDKHKVYWATAILDSRSIWWNGMRHLTPLLDLVNADSKGRAHETRLDDLEGQRNVAVTRASRPIKAGEQVMENYAQPNYLLFTYHGFLIQDNPNDCALLDGLYIHRDDPGARTAHHRLQTTTPTFCIRDVASIEELAFFLRVKLGLSVEDSSDSNIDDDLRPHLIEVLEQRIARLKESIVKSEVDAGDVPRLKFMKQMVKNDLMHFQHALNTHVLDNKSYSMQE